MDVIVAIAHKHTRRKVPVAVEFQRKELASNRFSGERFTQWSSVNRIELPFPSRTVEWLIYHSTALASGDQILDCPCEVLTAALTRVNNLSHLWCQVGHSNRAIPMRLPPRRKQFDHALSRGVALLDLSDAVHRVGTPEG